MKLDDDHTSAEMERLRVRRLWRAFAGGTDPSGPRSMLGRGLLTSIVLAVFVAGGTFVAGVIEATSSDPGEGGTVAANTTATPTPSTQPGPAATATTTPPPPPPTTAPPRPPTTSAPPQRRVDVTVSSTERWTDTGLDVSAGDLVHVEATGTVTAAVGDPSTNVGPDGSVNPEFVGSNRNENGVKVGGGHAALIGMIGEHGKPFLIGASNTLSIDTTGRLVLGVNDRGLENNGGHFDATLTVGRPGS
jgi:hypothetical protein